MDIAREVGYEPGGYTTRMGDVLKRAYLNLSDQPEGDAAIAERQWRRLNRVDGGVAGPRLPPPRKIAEQLHTEQAMRRAAGIFKKVAGRCVRVVDLVPVLRRKFEESVKSGAIKEPEGEGEFEMKMLIASWSDGGSKSSKGFYAETMGFLNDGRGLITREKSKAGARRDALERILVFLAVGRESKEMVHVAQTEAGEQFEKLAEPSPLKWKSRGGGVSCGCTLRWGGRIGKMRS